MEAYNFDKFILKKRKEIYNVYLQRQVEREYEQQVKKDNAALYPSLSARHVQAGESSEPFSRGCTSQRWIRRESAEPSQSAPETV